VGQAAAVLYWVLPKTNTQPSKWRKKRVIRLFFLLNKLPKFTKIVLLSLVILGLTGKFIAHQRPIWCVLEGKTHWPLFQTLFTNRINPLYFTYDEENKWQQLPASDRVMPLIPFTASATSTNRNLPPLSTVNGLRHWLGTDNEGRDVAAGLITGTQTALLTGFLALLVAFLVGGILGALAGYFGDDRLRISVSALVVSILTVITGIFLLFFSRKTQTGTLTGTNAATVLLLLTAGAALLIAVLKKWNIGQQPRRLPFDTLIMRAAELFESVPALIILLVAVSAMEERTLVKIIVLIGILSWTGTARFLRSELLKVRKMDYIRAVQRLGIPEWRVMFKHAIPNAIRPVFLMLALSASGAIMIEAALSFLNLGSADASVVTWGAMLETARQNIELWWVWLPPGLLIGLVAAAMFEWNESKFF
jgi:peptide/nickel transport system permease protein